MQASALKAHVPQIRNVAQKYSPGSDRGWKIPFGLTAGVASDSWEYLGASPPAYFWLEVRCWKYNRPDLGKLLLVNPVLYSHTAWERKEYGILF